MIRWQTLKSIMTTLLPLHARAHVGAYWQGEQMDRLLQTAIINDACDGATSEIYITVNTGACRVEFTYLIRQELGTETATLDRVEQKVQFQTPFVLWKRES